ncbi:MAG: Outer membrane beta-barrel assembly protein BamB [uncultured Sphingosinicella sp.]|uniref:Outer membrane beta-barrel assembly protein BamB n=1 Tax=uncultured Sphingosinicella sp. TaxID=478748 RepID=A0A6J4UAB3_9SPHN|nr:PQQ-binding-like beta-propeller repeat protein [uncultured Sphingosinicella sp.]CAA9542950.1 MAG: Outer membrane beta-barrel assembly protein BamB [uncultured Sphingosinicella sp.]
MKRVIGVVAAAAMLSGCGILSGREKAKTPTVGERIPVLGGEASVEVDPALADVAISLPPAAPNADWTQPGGNPSKSMGHLALGATPTRAWTAKIGRGSESRARLASAPVVGGGRVYTIDTIANVRAFDATTGAQVWSVGVGRPEDRQGGISWINGESTGAFGVLFGGGVSYDNNRVYATSGIGDVAAFDAATGAQIWRVRPGGPMRGAPTIANDNVYVTTQDNQLFALNPADGAVRWTASGTLETAGVFGTAAPAASQGTVVAGFSSGELTAYRYENGRVLWQDALARTSISTAVSSLSDIDADPVIDAGRVYAVGQGGRMVALELNTGQRVWEINLAGISTPWVIGEWIYVVNDQAQLLAIARATGKVKWMTQLPRWRDVEDKEGPLSWVGPVLAGDRLVLANNRGQITNVNPVDGTVIGTQETKLGVSLPPVVANNTLYILHDEGTLTAWR